MTPGAQTQLMVRWSSPLVDGRKSTSPGAPCLRIWQALSRSTFWKSGCVMRRLSTLGPLGLSLCASCSWTDRKSARARSSPRQDTVASHLSTSTSSGLSTTTWKVSPGATGKSSGAPGPWSGLGASVIRSAGRKACMPLSRVHHMPRWRPREPARTALAVSSPDASAWRVSPQRFSKSASPCSSSGMGGGSPGMAVGGSGSGVRSQITGRGSV
mmetsp:Transcript_342/g.970  ORF Transcript_342/g.970 Transcript_342/m.970 type:complete len:213 (+) Transcript_342:478-1116(+)